MVPAIALLALTSSATPVGAADGSAAPRQGGIELHLETGVSLNHLATEDGPRVDSVLGGPTITLGWRFASGLAIGGGIALHVGHAYGFTNYPIQNSEGVVIWPRLFAQVEYHTGGLRIGAAAGVGTLGATNEGCDCYNVEGSLNSASGPSLVVAPHLGYDWPVSKSWGIGVLGRLWLSPTDRYDEPGLVIAPELAFSASWF